MRKTSDLTQKDSASGGPGAEGRILDQPGKADRVRAGNWQRRRLRVKVKS